MLPFWIYSLYWHLSVFNKDAINSCRTWAWSTSLMGFCFVRLCAVLIVCWTLRGKTEVESWGASLCSLHVPRHLCVFVLGPFHSLCLYPLLGMNTLSVPMTMGFVQPWTYSVPTSPHLCPQGGGSFPAHLPSLCQGSDGKHSKVPWSLCREDAGVLGRGTRLIV